MTKENPPSGFKNCSFSVGSSIPSLDGLIGFVVELHHKYRNRDGSYLPDLRVSKYFSQPFLPQVGWVIEVADGEEGCHSAVSSVFWNTVMQVPVVKTDVMTYSDGDVAKSREEHAAFLMKHGWSESGLHIC
jgi:hypothetical protein